ncbi:peptidase domain-containing ABC transporter [Bacillus wiedmannii]|uniref:Peptidase C39 n=1 Tax=Bacillus wiedmannii TaxID=1890302 RepID=A0A2C4PTN4_9BACI|nr:peptidase domain-containing ABC transporter [Bacillus wiedmannii]PHD55573.1 peptidase C39 [Bacillus wiedmannii]
MKRRIPFIEQMEQSECGLCCLAMVLSYFKSEYTLWELRDRWGGGRDGINLLIIKKMAESLGLEATGHRISIANIKEIELPAILHWEGNHFVVVEKFKGNKVFILDPAIGRRVLLLEEIKDALSGMCISLKPTKHLEKRKVKGSWIEYLRFLWNEPWLVSSIVVFSLWVQILAIATPMFVQFIVDNVITPGGNDAYMNLLAIAIGILAVIQFVFSLLRARTLVKLQTRLDWNLMSRFFERLLKLPFHFFQLRSSGDLILRANSNLIVREILSNRTVTMLLDGGLVFLFLFYMFNQSVYLTMYVLAIGVLQVLLLLLSNHYTRRLSQEEILRQTHSSSYLAEVLRGILVVKSEGVESQVYKQWAGLFEEQMKAARRRGFFGAYIDSILQTLRFIAPLLVLWMASQEVIAQRMTVGSMFAFYTLAISFLLPLTNLITTVNQMIYMGTYFRRILDILEATPEQDDHKVIDAPTLEGDIQLKNVSFQYNTHASEVIKDVSLEIKSGQFVAIVGPTGSGKSTLASLLLGLYQPTKGKITFDGHNIINLDKSQFRKQIGVVTQQIHLFNRSIFNNITFHNDTLSEQEVMRAAGLAEIHNDIMKLPMKYQTLLSEEGSNISGGQRQRLALARALVHDPKILLLDEASSALDSKTEQKIYNNIDSLKCTKIVIAHRLSTVLRADTILVVDQGKVIERGTHEQLMNLKGSYEKLYNAQLQKENMGVMV